MTSGNEANVEETVDKLVGCLELSVLGAVGLSRVNLIRKPNTFVAITFNGELIGKTSVVNTSQDPVWNERFILNIPADKDISTCELEIYIYHSRPPDPAVFLGYRKITGSEIIFLGSLGDEENKSEVDVKEEESDEDSDEEGSVKHNSAKFELHSEPIPGKKQKSLNGKIVLWGHFHPHPPPPLTVETNEDDDMEDAKNEGKDSDDDDGSTKVFKSYLTLHVQLFAARDISNANTKGSISGSSNPFGIFKVNGHELQRTAVIGNTLSPHWHNEFIEIRFPGDFDIMKSTFEFELWHSNNPRKLKRSRFLGQVTLRADEYCAMAGCAVVDVMCMLQEAVQLMRSYDYPGDVSGFSTRASAVLTGRRSNSRPTSPEKFLLTAGNSPDGRPSSAHIARNTTMNNSRPSSALSSSRRRPSRQSSRESTATDQSKLVNMDIFDKGMPLWLDLKPSLQRSQAENSCVQGSLKVCFNFKLPPDKMTVQRGETPGVSVVPTRGLNIVRPCPTREMKHQAYVVVNILSIRGQIIKEAMKLKQLTSQTAGSVGSGSGSPSKTAVMTAEATDCTIPPKLFCVLRDMCGDTLGKTLPLDKQFSLRWEEERFWVPFPSRNYDLYPVLFTVEVYCIDGLGAIVSLGVLTISANNVLDTISNSSSCLGEVGGIGPFGELQPGSGKQWFDLEAPYFSDSDNESEGGQTDTNTEIDRMVLSTADNADNLGQVVRSSTAEEADNTPLLTHETLGNTDTQVSNEPSNEKQQLALAIPSTDVSSKKSLSKKKSIRRTSTILRERRGAISGLFKKLGPLGSLEIKYQVRTTPFDSDEVADAAFEGEDDIDDEVFSMHSESEDCGKITIKIGSLDGLGLDKSKRAVWGKKTAKAYCVVWFNGVCVGQTASIKLNGDTRWDESFECHFSGGMSRANSHIEIEMFKQTACKITPFNPYGVATYSAGVVELLGDDLLKLCSEDDDGEEDKEEMTFPLVESCRAFSVDEKPTPVGGILGLCGWYVPPYHPDRFSVVCQEDDYLDRELKYTPATVTLNVYEAADLANADLMGLSDPFVIVMWNGEEAGRTYVIDNTLNPVWADQVFSLHVPRYRDVLDCRLELHVYDDQTIGQNRFLGCKVLSGKTLKKVLGSDSNQIGPVWLDLEPSKFLSKKQNKLVHGSLLIQCMFSESHRQLRRWSVDHLKIEVFIFGCSDLSKIESRRKPNTFCLVNWEGNEMGRTTAVRKALSPQWEYGSDDSCRITIYLPEAQAEKLQQRDLEILVYHSDLCKESELLQNCICLGRALLKGQDLEQTFRKFKHKKSSELVPFRLPVSSFEKGSVICRSDTYGKASPQGFVDIGLSINNSENNIAMCEELATLDVNVEESDHANDVSAVSMKSDIQEEGYDYTTSADNALVPFSSTVSSSTSQYKMYLHHESGSFYYLNEATGDSSWDKPLDGSVELYHSQEELENIAQTRTVILQSRQERLEQLKAAVAIIRADHQETNQRLALEKKQREDRVIYQTWQKALTIASQERGECNISWQKCGGIDPLLYDFEKVFGMRLRALRLVGIALKSLPEEFGDRLHSLETLSLANNEMVRLPESLYKMYSLSHLDVKNNKLVALPEKIGLMATNLVRIELSNNKLESLPPTFAALVKIRRLDLENNCLRVLPENLDLMYMCEVINVNCNMLTRLPRCMGRMKSLKMVSANKNEISYIPLEICRSKSIQILRLCTNKITALPENIGSMKGLKELWLDHNFLSFLPVNFCGLSSLTLLRLEENRALEAPDQDIIRQGAQAVVQWSRMRWEEDGHWRRKRIIVTLQDCLRQVADMNIADPAKFNSEYKIHDDFWFALDWHYFWDFLLSELKRKWKKTIDTYDVVPRNEVLSFPFTKKDVMWALKSFQDAYGYVYSVSYANFKRCCCVDATGKRRPCVPPVKGYMCRKKCALIKHEVVLQHEKETRLWRAHQRHEIDEAVKRAEKEALKFLQSDDGKLWIAEMAFERAEEAMNGKGFSQALNWRERLAEKRKQKIIKKYDRKKKKILKQRDAKASSVLIEIEELKKTARMAAQGGYQKTSINQRLAEAHEELEALPENEILNELQQKCEEECDAIDDDLLYTDTSESDGSYHRESYMDRKRRLAREAEEKAISEVRGANVPEMPDSPDGNFLSDIFHSAVDIIPPKDRREVLLRRQKRRTKRFLRNTFDMVNMRVTKARLMMGGDFKEMQQELEHETYVQYISNACAVARRRAERDFYVLGKIRNQWKGLSVELCFRGWKKWVRRKTRREHADLRKKYRLECKQYEADAISLHLARAQLSMWKKFTDAYSDVPFWKNWQSGDMTWEQPKLEDYLPYGCSIPVKPTPLPEGVGEQTSSESEDEYFKPRIRDKGDEDDKRSSDSSENDTEVDEGEDDTKEQSLEMQEESYESNSVTSVDTSMDSVSQFNDEFTIGDRAMSSTTGSQLPSRQGSRCTSVDMSHVPSVSPDSSKKRNPNDFSMQQWKPLPSASLHASSSSRFPPLPSTSLKSSSATALATAPQNNGAVVPLGSFESPLSNALVPLQSSNSASSSAEMYQLALQGPSAKAILPVYSYGPDSLRAGKLRGRVGRPLFPEPIAGFTDDEEDEDVVDANSDAAKLLDGYSMSDESRAKAEHAKVDSAVQLKERSRDERNRALDEVKKRREKSSRVRNRTYIQQRDRRPRAAQDITEERKRREVAQQQFKRPTTPELLAMVNGDPNKVWKSEDIKERTLLATKAVKLQKKLREQAVAQGLIEEKKKTLKSAIMPLFDNDTPEEDDAFNKL